MDFVNMLISALGGGTVALAVAGYLGRQWLRQQLSKSLETYKAELTEKTEVLKTELSIYAHEQNVGLSRIDVQRSDAILAIWKILGEWQEHFISITAPNQRLEQNAHNAIDFYRGHSQELMRSQQSLSREVRNRTLFFDEETYAAIARCGLAISQVTTNYYAASYENFNPQTEQEVTAHLPVVQRARRALYDSARNSVDELRSALVKEFRRLMKAEQA